MIRFDNVRTPIYTLLIYSVKSILIFSIYDGSLGAHESDPHDVLEWVSSIAMEDNIEHISEQMLDRLLQDHKVT